MLHERIHGDAESGGEEADAGSVARFLGVLADPARLDLMELLCDGERTVSECAEQLHLSQGQVLGHLHCLVEAGHLRSSHRGQQTYYRVAALQTAHLIHLARSLATDNATELGCCSRISTEP
ncbi:ArsR/SmtB family transcription factor [Actinomadura sp. 9N215]|uniref:ArsR/SmtB family transcription factor n=1 Tax=Actinomadura sp. 9N215 TaxID=3375150 RepID=UPI0037B6A9A6